MSVRINAPDVLHESFGEESVIVNLRQGVYYSLAEEGLFLWEEIAKGTSIGRLLELAGSRSGGTFSTPSEIIGFLRQLHDEHQIVIEGETWPLPSDGTDTGQKAPVLQKFEDLHDLLTLDPIHEVDEKGWPHARSGDVNPG